MFLDCFRACTRAEKVRSNKPTIEADDDFAISEKYAIYDVQSKYSKIRVAPKQKDGLRPHAAIHVEIGHLPNAARAARPRHLESFVEGKISSFSSTPQRSTGSALPQLQHSEDHVATVETRMKNTLYAMAPSITDGRLRHTIIVPMINRLRTPKEHYNVLVQRFVALVLERPGCSTAIQMQTLRKRYPDNATAEHEAMMDLIDLMLRILKIANEHVSILDHHVNEVVASTWARLQVVGEPPPRFHAVQLAILYNHGYVDTNTLSDAVVCMFEWLSVFGGTRTEPEVRHQIDYLFNMIKPRYDALKRAWSDEEGSGLGPLWEHHD